ncbi:MAG: (deoxy)nucleoside triphosphate pyrophosphohydrolase [Actinomycetota bacterium]|nr:(deoxy)nucleoside triphosphate pyrophosphohydrolase [Actinomycetota bacterium]
MRTVTMVECSGATESHSTRYDFMGQHKMNNEEIEVAAAIIEKDGFVLITKRPDGAPYSGSWEFPGGKIEEGEGASDALEREIMEELGIKVEVGALLATVTHRYPEYDVRIFALSSRISEEESNIGDVEYAWVRPQDLVEYDLLPPDKEISRLVFGIGNAH